MAQGDAGAPAHDALCIVVMVRGAVLGRSADAKGVSGSGKSTVGSALAEALHVSFIDADSLHSEEAVAKMRSGHPLDDEDRWPWLTRVRDATCEAAQKAEHTRACIVACSALKVAYRNFFREAPPGNRFVFLYLDLLPELLIKRLEERQKHFMKAEMLVSQLGALEKPDDTDEPDVHTIQVASTMDRSTVLASSLACLREAYPQLR